MRIPVLLAAATLLGASSSAQAPPFRLAATPDPLRLASLPFDPAVAALPPPGGWQVAASVAYFNLWQGTWHAGALHRELHREGQPLASAELRELERRYPDTDIYHLDLEGWLGEVVVSRGLPGGIALCLRLPWLEVGTPHWDAVGEKWHSLFGMPDADRGLFPRSQTVLYARGRGGVIERREELRGSRLGDATLALAVPLPLALGGTHRLVAALEAPTGERGTLAGSGGWDVGLRWFGSWQWRSRSMLLGAGYTWLDHNGELLGLERVDTWHLLAQLDQRLGRGFSGMVAMSYERSPLAAFTRSALGKPAAFLRLGVVRQAGAQGWVGFEVGQDFYGAGVAPDYAFRLLAGTAFPR
jgi:hypothetical protein